MKTLNYPTNYNIIYFHKNYKTCYYLIAKKQSLEKKHRYGTRSKGIPKRPSAPTRQYHSSYLFQSLKDYENTSPEIRNSTTLSTFTYRMKKFLLKE